MGGRSRAHVPIGFFGSAATGWNPGLGVAAAHRGEAMFTVVEGEALPFGETTASIERRYANNAGISLSGRRPASMAGIADALLRPEPARICRRIAASV